MMATDSGVSPVIGVLLMLTLTLIIAAIVNSFAGGLMDTKEKLPSATLQASFYQSHLGGCPRTPRTKKPQKIGAKYEC